MCFTDRCGIESMLGAADGVADRFGQFLRPSLGCVGCALAGSLVGCVRTLWGVAAGLLFLLAFPLAIVLAPLLWAFGRLRGEADDHGSDSLL
jgi:hypothetical protein